MPDRREFVRAALGALVGAAAIPRDLWADGADGADGAGGAGAQQSRRRITVYKTASCDCCKKWVDLVKAGTDWIVDVKDVEDIDKIKNQFRVPRGLRSCHTAVVGRFTFEGHVPVDLMKYFLERPRGVAGLAVPGMPVGSPGMEVPGRAPDHYQVIGFYRDGRTFVFANR
jgi:hypothetical protein